MLLEHLDVVSQSVEQFVVSHEEYVLGRERKQPEVIHLLTYREFARVARKDDSAWANYFEFNTIGVPYIAPNGVGLVKYILKIVLYLNYGLCNFRIPIIIIAARVVPEKLSIRFLDLQYIEIAVVRDQSKVRELCATNGNVHFVDG